MRSYHGTSAINAIAIRNETIDVTIGGGELGRGFYSGEHLHEAKAWAYHQSGDLRANVVALETPDNDVENMDLKIMDFGEAGLRRYQIRRNDETRTFTFGCDMVWAPIVGAEKVSGDQYKWESNSAALTLNDSSKTNKEII